MNLRLTGNNRKVMEDLLPLVTVVIPTYSRPNNLIRAINSVLEQTYPHIEIIVVDDNGLDSKQQVLTYSIVKDLINNNKIKYIPHKENKNGSAARNTGLRSAKGAFICFLDDDDVYLPTKIQKQVEALMQTPNKVGGAFCSCLNYACDANGMEIRTAVMKNQINGNLMPDILDETSEIYFGTSKWMMKTEVCKEIGGFDEDFRRNQDLEFLVRFSRKYDIISVCPDEYLMKYDITDIDNHINPEVLFNVKRLLFTKYSQDIKRHNAKLLCDKTWYNVFLISLRYGKFNVALKSIGMLQSYSILLREPIVVFKALTKCMLLNMRLVK